MSDDIQLVGPGAEGAGGGGAGRIQVRSSVLAEIDQHVESDTTVEQGGVLVGDLDAATGATVITARIPAVGAISEVASLRFTHETWDHINGVMERDHPDARMVGWYHSHPHFGIFLSEYDQFIHNNFFSQPWQVAYVVDPLLRQRGFFAWVDGSLVRVPSWETWHTETGAADAPVGTPPPRPAAPPPAPPVAGAAPVPGPVAPPPPDPDKISPWSLGVLLLLVIALVAAVIAVTDPFADDTEPAFRIVVPDGGLEHEATAGAPTRLGKVTVTGADENEALGWTYLPTDDSDSPPEAITAAATPAEDDGNSYRLTWQSDPNAVHDEEVRSGVLLAFPCPTGTSTQECLAAGGEIASVPIALRLTPPAVAIPTSDAFTIEEGTQPYVDEERLAVYQSLPYPDGVTVVGTMKVRSTVIDQLDVSGADPDVVQAGLAPHLGFPRGDEVDQAPALSADARGNMNANALPRSGDTVDVSVIDPSGRAERNGALACGGGDGVSSHCQTRTPIPPGDDSNRIMSTLAVITAINDVPPNAVAGLFLTLVDDCPTTEIDLTMAVVAAAVRERSDVLWVVPDTTECPDLAADLADLENVVTVSVGDDERESDIEVRPNALPTDEDADTTLDAAAIVMGAAAETWSPDPGAKNAAEVAACLLDGRNDNDELRVKAAREVCFPDASTTPTAPPGFGGTTTVAPEDTTTSTSTPEPGGAPSGQGGDGGAAGNDG